MAVKNTRASDRCIEFPFDDLVDASPTKVLVIIGSRHVHVSESYD
nr:hypothetical protein [Candidatus Sigynarchaeum springense]